MHEELRKEIIRLLTAAGMGFTWYDHVPQGTDPPYGAVGDCHFTAEDTSDSDGGTFKYPLHVFSKYKGGKQASQALDQIRAALHHMEGALSLSTGTAITMYVESSDQEPNADDGKTREAVATVSVLVDDIASGTA